MRLKVRKLHPDAKLPERAHDTDSGFDIWSIEAKTIQPFVTEKFRTGICVQLDETSKNMGNGVFSSELYCIQFKERSSVGSRGIGLRAGLVDSNYIGELIVCLTNHNNYPVQILKGDKIAQFIVQKVETPYVLEVEKLDDTSRGMNGFGSTGTT